MHRIDGPGATADNRFTEGDPVAGTPATVVTDDFMNDVQEEIMSVLIDRNIAPVKGKQNQLLTAIKALAANIAQATEVVMGGGKVSTQQLIEEGASDAVFVTPKKLLFGMDVLLNSSIGYIRFPSWCKRFTIAWGSAGHNTPTTFPVGFTAIPRAAALPTISTATPTSVSYTALSATSITLLTGNGSSSSSYIVVGFS